MGSINDLAQMSPLLKFHKRSGKALLRKVNGNNNSVLMVMDDLRRDLIMIMIMKRLFQAILLNNVHNVTIHL